ncbi:MAG: hypothetical protein V4619_16925, partial [Bacteroidota bacterium]
DLLLAGQVRHALEVYRAKLLRGEKPEVTAEVFAALTLEGLSYGTDIMFADEARKLEQDRKRQHRW